MKKSFKKITAVFVAVIVVVGAFAGCSTSKKENDDKSKISIVATIFPEYDWVKNILGSHIEDVELTLLLDSGVDLHSYQPTADDIIKISECDMFIYVGGESDEWVEDALAKSTNSDMVVINMLDVLGENAKEEEIVEGMQEDDHDHGEDETEEHTHEDEYDEHVWLSFKNAQTICEEISKGLAKIDIENANDYANNLNNYVAQLSDLDKQYQETVDNAKFKTVVFADRFPFRYMVDDYGLEYYAAFAGCFAETEASFETIKFLSEKVDKLNLNAVLTIENPQHQIAQTVVENTKNKNQQILSMNSLQSITSSDVENGVTYISVMTENLEVLKEALS